MEALRAFPAIVMSLLVSACLMMIPAAHAARLELWPVARAFLQYGLLIAVFAVIVGIATMNRRPRGPARYHLMTLLASYVALPAVLALPLVAATPTLSFSAGYFEMVSSITTTGATVFDRPAEVADPIHLWRALVGWAGGLMILIAAFGVLAPLNLGGFEIEQETERRLDSMRMEEADARIRRVAHRIAPAYAVFTAVLAIALAALGDPPFVAICHAMATISTSAISPIGGVEASGAGRAGEAAVALFLLLAVSHRGLSFDLARLRPPRLGDPQIQLMLISVVGITAVLFLRSYIGAVEIDRQDNLAAALQAIWGSLFTVLSFLTTTGFESRDWRTMQIWSDLPAPGILLLGVAVMGGGVATTAGGVRLLRLYALYRHGLREMDHLIHPSGLGRRGVGDRLISPHGARIAFVFLMLFLITLALVWIALAATGVSFERSLALAVAGLTTTGPAIRVLGDGLGYGVLSDAARCVLCVAMIVGRMEALVIIALFNPAYWRQ